MEDKNLYPNSFQVNNFYIDKCLHLLDGNEIKVLLYVIRRIIGFNKQFDFISLSQFEKGIKSKDGQRLDFGVGLSRPSIAKALNQLSKYGFLVELEKTQSSKIGNAYTLEFDYSKINLTALENRELDKGKDTNKNPLLVKNIAYTNPFTSKNGLSVDQPKNDQKTVELLVNGFNTQNSEEEEKNKKKENITKEKVLPETQRDEQAELVVSPSPEKILDFSGKVTNLKSKKPKPQQTTFPEPFLVTKDLQAWVKENCPLVDFRLETQQFKDWALAKGETKVDWVAAWRRWMRETQKRLSQQSTKPAFKPQDKPTGVVNINTNGEFLRKQEAELRKLQENNDPLDPEVCRQIREQYKAEYAAKQKAKEEADRAEKKRLASINQPASYSPFGH